MISPVVFTPALGTTLRIPLESHIVSLFATSIKPVYLVARLDDGTAINFEETDTPALGSLRAYRVSIPKPRLPAVVTLVHADGNPISASGSDTVQLINAPSATENAEFSSSITLSASEDSKSVLLDWLDASAWEGWAWQRMRPTWIEANYVEPLVALEHDKSTHCLLLRPSDTEKGKQFALASVLAVFPASSRDAFVTLTGARGDEIPGVYARVRRIVAMGKEITVHVTGCKKASKGERSAIHGAIQHARRLFGLAPAQFTKTPGTSPFDRLGFCTWSSIGENVPLNLRNMTELVQLLKKDCRDVPIGTFIIDDGWQDIRRGRNGHADARGLWSFDTWDGMGCTLTELVTMVKTELASVTDVGVWMTLAGYWNSVAPGSPLDIKYGMKRYRIERTNVPGQDWSTPDFDLQQTGTINDSDGRYYVLPPPERAAEFWTDYFSACAAAGVDFVKVDNQAYGSFLEGVEGGQEFVALWDAMFAAANTVFGKNRVIHCMAHYERVFSGDIGLGIPTDNQKIIVRNSDDFGLDRPDVHRDHVHYNLYNAMLLGQLAVIPDADMFMTSAQWPQYHAILRAFFSQGPVLLADLPGKWDVQIVKKLIAQEPSGQWTVVRASETARPLKRNVWEKTLHNGPGPSIKAASSFGKHGATILMWNARTGGLDYSADVLFEGDILDALGETVLSFQGSPIRDYALWLGVANKATSFGFEEGTAQGPVSDTTRMDRPVLATSLPPAGLDVITVTPMFRIGSTQVAVLGLVDKYAGLAAIQDTRVVGDGIVIHVRLAGQLGILIYANVAVPTPNVIVDGQVVFSVMKEVGFEAKDGSSLLTVDLATVKPAAGKSTFTVEVRI